jgi:hypothetical protein
LAVIPGALAVYGGQLAAESVMHEWRRRKIKIGFWLLFVFLVVSTSWQQVRIAEADQTRDTKQSWSEAIVKKAFFSPPPAPVMAKIPPAPTPKPDLGIEFVSPGDVAFRMVNLSDAIVRDAKYSFILIDLDGPRTAGTGDSAIPQILQIPTTVNSGDFLKPKQKYLQRPMSTFQGVQAVVKPGDRVFGYVVVTCPNCIKERRYWLYFVNGPGGWYSEFSGDGAVKLPIGAVLTDSEKALAQIAPAEKRIPISNPN